MAAHLGIQRKRCIAYNKSVLYCYSKCKKIDTNIVKYSLRLLVMLTIIITNPIHLSAVEPQTYIESFEVPPMQIVPEGETKTDKEFIKEIITMKAKEYGVNAQVAIRIAECESSLDPHATNTNINGSTDGGIFQVNSIHNATVSKLGLDMSNMYDNIEYAMMLMKENGTKDWYSSQHCWSKV